jgi:hypothetical protein
MHTVETKQISCLECELNKSIIKLNILAGWLCHEDICIMLVRSIVSQSPLDKTHNFIGCHLATTQNTSNSFTISCAYYISHQYRLLQSIILLVAVRQQGASSMKLLASCIIQPPHGTITLFLGLNDPRASHVRVSHAPAVVYPKGIHRAASLFSCYY